MNELHLSEYSKLVAENAALRAEVERLIEAVADHVTVRAEQYAELQKYRDAPVICSQYQDLWGNWCLFLDEKHEVFVRKSEEIPVRTLIVKPGE